ncbi:MAG: hypothetical protein JSS04_09055 [Proteobacteria bacterium]|nr:hypothetical protein [Pseudomonadota bacterium]
MEYFLGGVLFTLFIVAQALALLAVGPMWMQKPRQSESQPGSGQAVTGRSASMKA